MFSSTELERCKFSELPFIDYKLLGLFAGSRNLSEYMYYINIKTKIVYCMEYTTCLGRVGRIYPTRFSKKYFRSGGGL